MAYDEGLAQIMRDDIGARTGLTEQKMFGGLAFLLDGKMVCGVWRDGGLYRVGRQNMEAALAIDGAEPMRMGDRTMGGMIALPETAMADDEQRDALLRLALACVDELLAKS